MGASGGRAAEHPGLTPGTLDGGLGEMLAPPDDRTAHARPPGRPPGRRSQRPPDGRRPGVAFWASLAIVVVLAVLDADAGGDRILTATVVLGPFLASLFCTVREVVAVAVAAAAAALLSLAWTPDAVSLTHFVRIAVVLAGGTLAVLGARERIRARAVRRRLEILAEIAEVSDGRLGLRETAARIADLVVPEIADTCVIDVVRGRGVERLAVRVDGPGAEELEAAVAGRLGGRGGHASPATVGEPRVVTVDDAVRQRMAAGEEDLALLRRLGVRTALVVPLGARDRRVGGVTLTTTARSGRDLGARDLEFARILGGRIALALDNAGLSSDLAAAERRLATAFDALAAAVLVQRPGEGIVYANRAAAELMGMPTPEDLMAATPDELGEVWRPVTEDGAPLTPDRYPSRRILTGADLHPPPLVTRAVHPVTGRETWALVKAEPVFDDDGELLMAVSVTEDITAMKRAELVERLLAEAGRVLSSALDVERTLEELARLVVPELADWCSVSVPGEDGTVSQVAVAHRDPAKVALAEDYNRRFPSRMDAPGGVGAVLRGEGSQLLADVSDAMLREAAADADQLRILRAVGMRSVLVVPIAPPGAAPLGALTLVDAESGRVFTEADVAVAEELGRRAGVAMQNARLYAEQGRIAATLQDALLPDELPSVPGYAVATAYRPAGRGTWVGGDFYDAFRTPAGWVVLVGDVAGHGVEAAALTAQARYTVRSVATLTGDLLGAMEHLNAALARRRRLSLCTLCAVLLPDADGDGRTAEVVSAGHPLPIRVRGGHAQRVGHCGPLLGAFEEAAFEVADVEFAPGDVLVLHTDGVTDARGRRERFGDERLADALAGATGAADAIRRIEAALDAFQTGPPPDDTAVLAVARAAG